MASENNQAAVVDWFYAPDQSVSIQTEDSILLASKSHPFNKLIVAACRRDEFTKAIGYIRLDRNVSQWSSDSVRFKNGVWYVDGRRLGTTRTKELNALHAAGLEASVIASVLIKQQNVLDNAKPGVAEQATVITSPLESADSCEISYYGWLEYLRRYGSECLDTQEDFVRKTFSVLSRSKKSGRVAFTATNGDSVLLATEVPGTLTKCDKAIEWMEANLTQFNSVSVQDYLSRRTQANDVTQYYQRQIRKITVKR